MKGRAKALVVESRQVEFDSATLDWRRVGERCRRERLRGETGRADRAMECDLEFLVFTSRTNRGT